MFAGNFAPAGWMFCSGQLLPISENEVLFQLIGTTYGGDGESTFSLPDLQSRVPVHMGAGYVLAQAAGSEEVTLTVQQIPAHRHPAIATTAPGTTNSPAGALFSQSPSVQPYIQDEPTGPLAASSVAPIGGSQPHTNIQPRLALSFIISLFGIFPSPT